MFWTHIYFDLDNTLYDHEKAFRETVIHFASEMLASKKASVSSTDWFDVFKGYCDEYWDFYESGKWSRETYQIKRFQSANEKFNITSSAEEALTFQSDYEANVAGFAELFPGAEALLTSLARHNVILGIITNGESEVQASKIKQLELEKWIDYKDIYISQNIGLSKPDPQVFTYAKQGGGNYLYIGDSWKQDIKPALEAGYDAIYFNSTQMENSPYESTIPEVTNFEELSKVLLRK